MCTIEFRVTAKVRLGETIHLLGDAALGYFEPTESVQLSTTPDSYPVWRTTQALNFAPGHTLKYRCGSLCSWPQCLHTMAGTSTDPTGVGVDGCSLQAGRGRHMRGRQCGECGWTGTGWGLVGTGIDSGAAGITGGRGRR
jgi:hypothetical protein